MIVIPTLELMDGKVVSLTRGRLEEPVLWHVDPIEVARGWAADGASWMHITDFDGVEGRAPNDALVEEILRAAGIPVQIAGGFKSRERVEYWIDKGAGRVVLGSLAARQPDLVLELAKYYPDQIVVAVDVWQGQLMGHGWRTPSAMTPEAFVAAFDGAPLAAIMITDIDADIGDGDGALGVISGLAGKVRHPVIASGTVWSADDIARLKYVPNVAGTLVGRALFRKDLTLAEALEIAQPDPEPVAEFR